MNEQEETFRMLSERQWMRAEAYRRKVIELVWLCLGLFISLFAAVGWIASVTIWGGR